MGLSLGLGFALGLGQGLLAGVVGFIKKLDSLVLDEDFLWLLIGFN